MEGEDRIWNGKWLRGKPSSSHYHHHHKNPLYCHHYYHDQHFQRCMYFLRFETREEYLATEMSDELKTFYLKKAWTNNYAENETWACKLAKKAGYLKCGHLVKREFLSHSTEVVIYNNGEPHRHEPNLEYVNGGKKYLWSRVQEEILLPLIRNKLSAVICLRELEKKDCPNALGIYPNLTQINSKRKYMYQKQVMEEMTLLVSDLSLVSSFFEYFLLQWGPGSHVQNWYAGDSSKMHIHMDPTRSGHTISKY